MVSIDIVGHSAVMELELTPTVIQNSILATWFTQPAV